MTPKSFRRIALALPDTIESSHQGTVDFRARNRIFATLGYPDESWGVVKLTPEQQSVLVEAEPEIFRPVPNAWGKSGHTQVRLAKADAVTLKSALTMAWGNIAEKPPAKSKTKSKPKPEAKSQAKASPKSKSGKAR